uniref:Uncharacterized protein n=1 Tax=Oryza meridionalis TaxID=40149 RepID=A0A0E0F5L7_9ORYZ
MEIIVFLEFAKRGIFEVVVAEEKLIYSSQYLISITTQYKGVTVPSLCRRLPPPRRPSPESLLSTRHRLGAARRRGPVLPARSAATLPPGGTASPMSPIG